MPDRHVFECGPVPAVRELYNAGLAELGDDEDYTGIVKRLERQVGVELEG